MLRLQLPSQGRGWQWVPMFSGMWRLLELRCLTCGLGSWGPRAQGGSVEQSSGEVHVANAAIEAGSGPLRRALGARLWSEASSPGGAGHSSQARVSQRAEEPNPKV